MRLHTDSLSISDVREAARFARVDFVQLTEHGSRKRSGAFEVKLSGSSSHRARGGYDAEMAATHDEWGMFLGMLYRRDPLMVCTGGGQYESAEHFNWITGNAFANEFMPRAQHRQHRWQFSGTSPMGTYSVHECKCGAILRYLRGGHSFAELSLV